MYQLFFFCLFLYRDKTSWSYYHDNHSPDCRKYSKSDEPSYTRYLECNYSMCATVSQANRPTQIHCPLCDVGEKDKIRFQDCSGSYKGGQDLTLVWKWILCALSPSGLSYIGWRMFLFFLYFSYSAVVMYTRLCLHYNNIMFPWTQRPFVLLWCKHNFIYIITIITAFLSWQFLIKDNTC